MGRSDGMVVNKRMSFLASLVWGVCSIVIVTVVCVSGVAFYGLHIVESSIDNLPGIVKKVPMLRDALSSERRIDYIDDLEITVGFTDHPWYEDRMRAVATITNNGDELVSLLNFRIVVSDEDGNVLDEDVETIVTPIAIDDDLPGPLVPGQTRTFTTCTFERNAHPSATYEITDIHVWAPGVWDDDEEEVGGTAEAEPAMLSSAAAD